VGAGVRVTVRDGGRITLFDPVTEERLGAAHGAGIPSSLGS
jgi:hypothetical protein